MPRHPRGFQRIFLCALVSTLGMDVLQKKCKDPRKKWYCFLAQMGYVDEWGGMDDRNLPRIRT